MNKKNKLGSRIILLAVIVIICIPIIIDMVGNSGVKTIKYSEFESTVNDTASYKFSLVYIAPEDDENTKTTKNEIKDIFSESFEDESETSAYFMNLGGLSSEEITSLGLDTSTTGGYVFISNGEVLKVVDESNMNSTLLKDYINEYGYNGVSEELTNYKVAKDAKTYLSLVNKKKTITMAVFGRNNCYYCNRFLPVYNTVAGDYGLDIYYFDSLTYDEDEYNKIMDAGLKIPAECTDNNEEAKLEAGFGTPLTLFTKNGKVIDCISGYVNKSELVTKLKTVGLIETE